MAKLLLGSVLGVAVGRKVASLVTRSMNRAPAIISPLFRDPLLNADKGSGSRGEVNHEIVGCDHEFVVVVADVRLIGQRVLAGGVADGQSGDRIFRLICDDPV